MGLFCISFFQTFPEAMKVVAKIASKFRAKKFSFRKSVSFPVRWCLDIASWKSCARIPFQMSLFLHLSNLLSMLQNDMTPTFHSVFEVTKQCMLIDFKKIKSCSNPHLVLQTLHLSCGIIGHLKKGSKSTPLGWLYQFL